MSFAGCTKLNNVTGSLNVCTGELEYAAYNHNVTAWTAWLFVALFALSSMAHLVQGIRSHCWFLLWTVLLCGLGELVGWGGRLWSAISTEWSPAWGGYWASSSTAFLMQIAALIISPAFLTAGWYVILGRVIQYIGPQYCSLTDLTYLTLFFFGGDVLCLVVQALGGATAAGAQKDEAAEKGAQIMIAGVIVQMVIMVLYSLVFAEFGFRYLKNAPVQRQLGFRRKGSIRSVPFNEKGSRPRAAIHRCEILLAAMVFSTLLIFVRSVYRTVELLDGWNGPIISNEALFCALDALTVFLALAVFNIVHPGTFMPRTLGGDRIACLRSPDEMVLEDYKPNSSSTDLVARD